MSMEYLADKLIRELDYKALVDNLVVKDPHLSYVKVCTEGWVVIGEIKKLISHVEISCPFEKVRLKDDIWKDDTFKTKFYEQLDLWYDENKQRRIAGLELDIRHLESETARAKTLLKEVRGEN